MQYTDKTIPLYKQIANDMRKKIVQGVWKPQDKLPPEENLSELYAVSRITIRKAENQLISERLITKARGHSAYVSNPDDHSVSNATLINQHGPHIKEIFNDHKKLTIALKTTFADIHISRLLQVPLNTKLNLLVRKIFDDEGTIALFNTYFIADGISMQELRQFVLSRKSFYAFLGAHDIDLQIKTEVISAMMSNTDLNEQFGFRRHHALLKRERIVSSLNHDYTEYSECFYVSDKYRFVLDFSDDTPQDILY